MNPHLPEFSPDQWGFLSALEACGEPVPLDIAQAMAPLDPESSPSFLNRLGELGWISITRDNHVGLTRDLPDTVRLQLKNVNTPDRVSLLLQRVRGQGISRSLKVKLLADSGRTGESAGIQAAVAHDYLKQGDLYKAVQSLSGAVERLRGHIAAGERDDAELFMESTFKLSNLCCASGRLIPELSSYLRMAANLAEAAGNQRSHALACLHQGRLLFLSGRGSEALKMLLKGREEVERLGDTDIRIAAAEFLGLCAYMRGQFGDTIVFCERAQPGLSVDEEQLWERPLLPHIGGSALTITGQVTRAIGSYQFFWRLAQDKGWHALASPARAGLGIVLCLARKRKEALFHLNESLEQAIDGGSAVSVSLAKTGLAIQSFFDENLEEAHELLQSAVAGGQNADLLCFHSNPYLLDMLASFHNQGFEPIAADWGYKEQLNRGLSESNLLLRGSALRVRAEDRMRSGQRTFSVMRDLLASKECLNRSGAELAIDLTLISMARFRRREGSHAKARSLARRVRHDIRRMGIGEEFFPEDLRFLLDNGGTSLQKTDSGLEFIDRYLKALHALDVAEGEEELLYRTIRVINQLLGAERGALFWSPSQLDRDTLEFRAGCNLTKREVNSEAFEPSLAAVTTAFKENQPVLVRPKPSPRSATEGKIKGLLCVPIRVGSQVRGVLYHDIYYVDDYLDFFAPKLMTSMANHATYYIGHLLECIRLREETSRQAADKSMQLERLGRAPILTQAPNTLRVLQQAEHAAKSDATVLVTGETGTGKELVAGRLHKWSDRSSGPFIVVDSTRIPVNLAESELFGHERGAFTGADRQKRGRIEPAHKGTLFIDEIAELPLQVQAKLLRALETRTFYRVGGTRSVKSDFRLVAATNRRLSEEVEAGRFRQDLYYRLNVISLVLPPLRDRGHDIILLARHFLRYYRNKYGRHGLELSLQQEDILSAYHWPGNVRELKNIIERAVVLSTGDNPALELPFEPGIPKKDRNSDTLTLDEVQRRHITRILEETGGRIGGPGGAAELLGMKRSSLYTRMYKLGLRQIDSGDGPVDKLQPMPSR